MSDDFNIAGLRENLKNAKLVVLHNQIKFNQTLVGAESIVKESRIISEPLNL